MFLSYGLTTMKKKRYDPHLQAKFYYLKVTLKVTTMHLQVVFQPALATASSTYSTRILSVPTSQKEEINHSNRQSHLTPPPP